MDVQEAYCMPPPADQPGMRLLSSRLWPHRSPRDRCSPLVSDILEHGRIAFLYRPRVEHGYVLDLGDVQRVYLLLRPVPERARRIVVGRKRLPRVGAFRQRFWGYVDRAGSTEQVVEDLGELTYETATRGTRHQPAARIAAEGAYALVRHDGHTDLEYALDLPDRRGDVQRALHIERQARYIVAVFNPESPRLYPTTRPRAVYPPELQARFGDRRFSPVDPPSLLDFRSTELVLIGARASAAEASRLARTEASPPPPDALADELHLPSAPPLLAPLLDGDWR